MKIYKYELPIEDKGCIEIENCPLKVMHIGEQDGKLFVWILVSDTSGTCKIKYHIIGTGFTIPDEVMCSDGLFKTVQMSNGFVGHVKVKL